MNSILKQKNIHAWTHQSGVFLSVCGVGGLLSIWATHSVYVLVNPEPWMGGMILVIGIGLFLYTHTHPSKRAK
jgi:hypothetical protein